MKGLFEHSSYRKYLRDLLAQEKSQAKGVSQASFARRLGLSAPHFQMILDGTRNLSIDHCHQIARKLHLDHEEEQYLEALVLSDQAGPEGKRYYRRRLTHLRERKATMTRVEMSVGELQARWDAPALLLYLVERLKVGDSPLTSGQVAQVQREFGLKPAELERFVTSFRQAGLLAGAPAGRLVHFNRVSKPTAQKLYVKSVYAEAMRRIDSEFERTDSAFQSHTFTIDPDRVEELIDDYRKLMERYIGLAPLASDDDRAVVQSGFSMFKVV